MLKTNNITSYNSRLAISCNNSMTGKLSRTFYIKKESGSLIILLVTIRELIYQYLNIAVIVLELISL